MLRKPPCFFDELHCDESRSRRLDRGESSNDRGEYVEAAIPPDEGVGVERVPEYRSLE